MTLPRKAHTFKGDYSFLYPLTGYSRTRFMNTFPCEEFQRRSFLWISRDYSPYLMVERTYMQKGRIRAPQKLWKLLILCYVIVSKHPQCAAGTVQNSSTRIRSEGEWQPGPRQPSAAPWLPDPPAPLPRAGEKQNAASGSAPQWLAPCQTSRTSRAHGRKWPEPSAQVTEQRPELCAVLCRGGGARAHTRTQLPKAAATRPAVWTRRLTAWKWPAATSSWGLHPRRPTRETNFQSWSRVGLPELLERARHFTNAPLFLQSETSGTEEGCIFDLSTLWWTSKLHVCFWGWKTLKWSNP